MVLKSSRTQIEVAKTVEVADDIWARMKGLLGRSHLPAGQALWIKQCNSIHTYFMKFPIDVIFVDQSLRIKKIYRNLGPWKFTLPVLSASSVFEFAADTVPDEIIVGDQLNVGD